MLNTLNGFKPKEVNNHHVMKVVMFHHQRRRKRMVVKCQKQVAIKTNKKAVLHLKRVIHIQNLMSVIGSLH
jgi:hypothetical protein